MTHFHLMRTQKHKILSIIVLNMAKYTIISLILIDFVPIFFIFNLFRRIFRGSFRFKKIPSSKKSQVDFSGGVKPFFKIPKFKKAPTPLGSSPFPEFPRFLVWKLPSIITRVTIKETQTSMEHSLTTGAGKCSAAEYPPSSVTLVSLSFDILLKPSWLINTVALSFHIVADKTVIITELCLSMDPSGS